MSSSPQFSSSSNRKNPLQKSMEDDGEGKKIEVTPMSNKLRWDTILAFITSSDVDDGFLKKITEEKEERRRKNKDGDYEDKQILEFKKIGLNSLEGVKCFVEREMERLTRNEVDEEEEGFFPLKCFIPKRKRTVPSEEEEEHTTTVPNYIPKGTTTAPVQCFQGRGSSSTSKKHQEEHRIIKSLQKPKNDRQYYHHKQQIANKFKKPRPAAKRQAPEPEHEPKTKKVRKGGVQAAKFPPVPQSIPDDIKEEIEVFGGKDITWLTEKELTKTDIKKSQNRLFVPRDCYGLLDSIMTEDEKSAYVVTNDSTKGLKTRVIDSKLNVLDMDFKYWPSLPQIVFTGGWNKLVACLALVPGNKVQIWCFRVPAGPDMKLCFAINKVRPPAPAPEPEM